MCQGRSSDTSRVGACVAPTRGIEDALPAGKEAVVAQATHVTHRATLEVSAQRVQAAAAGAVLVLASDALHTLPITTWACEPFAAGHRLLRGFAGPSLGLW